MLGDVVSAARHRVLGGKGPVESWYADLPLAPADSAVTRYQVRVAVADRPGVLAQVAQAVAAHGVSIEAVRQPAAVDGATELLITYIYRSGFGETRFDYAAALTIVQFALLLALTWLAHRAAGRNAGALA